MPLNATTPTHADTPGVCDLQIQSDLARWLNGRRRESRTRHSRGKRFLSCGKQKHALSGSSFDPKCSNRAKPDTTTTQAKGLIYRSSKEGLSIGPVNVGGVDRIYTACQSCYPSNTNLLILLDRGPATCKARRIYISTNTLTVVRMQISVHRKQYNLYKAYDHQKT